VEFSFSIADRRLAGRISVPNLAQSAIENCQPKIFFQYCGRVSVVVITDPMAWARSSAAAFLAATRDRNSP
jgi:hypothetical protein